MTALRDADSIIITFALLFVIAWYVLRLIRRFKNWKRTPNNKPTPSATVQGLAAAVQASSEAVAALTKANATEVCPIEQAKADVPSTASIVFSVLPFDHH